MVDYRTWSTENVLDAALRRIDWLFDQFPLVICSFSGGKDSTTVVNLALEVAEKKGRLPLHVMFLDQEGEWDCTIDYARRFLHDPRIDMAWLQVPFKIFNASSQFQPWLMAWEPGGEWLREKEPDSIHENVFDCDRFKGMLDAYARWYARGRPLCQLTGVRCEESPGRRLGLTTHETWKGETWGSKTRDRNRILMHPIYDWSYRDVWKAIHDHGWDYCSLYDSMYQYGIGVRNMRVSNVHHETALTALHFMQEVEPDTWNRITERLTGIASVGQLTKDFEKVPKRVPYMFKDWAEYRDHLLEGLIVDEKIKASFRHQFKMWESYFPSILDDVIRTEIVCILKNDYHGTTFGQFQASHLHHRAVGYNRVDEFTVEVPTAKAAT